MYKSKYTAWILAIFLWGIWIHKFYLGKWWQGILYILFSWTFIPMIIWILEWFWYLSTLQVNFDKTYNKGYIKDGRSLLDKIWLWTKKDFEDFFLWLLVLFIIWIIYIILK